MKSLEVKRSEPARVYKGRMLPAIEVGHDQYDELFNIALRCVSEVSGTPEKIILGRERTQPYPVLRFMLYNIVRYEIGTGDDAKCGMMPSVEWIGNKFGSGNPGNKRDHGSVIHGIAKLEEFLVVDRTVEPMYARILARFEIARAEYLSLSLDEANREQIMGLKKAAATIAIAIKNHEDSIASVMEQLAKAELEGDNNENMVQDKCSSDG